jgi:queuosine precursor transporter
MKKLAPIIAAIGFALTVVAANWTLKRYGFVSIGFGLMAPAGVYWAGLAFGLRDAVHELGGRSMVFAAIASGSALSYIVEPNFAIASVVAFTLSELADFAVYAPLRKRQWLGAVVASNIVGSVVDSVLFLRIAFGGTSGWFDLTVGKTYMIVPGVLIVGLVRRIVISNDS